MRRAVLVGLCGAAGFLCGCETTGLSTRELGGSTYLKMVYGLYATQEVRTNRVVVSAPINLAIAQVGETTPPEDLLAELRQSPALIARIMPLPLPGEDAAWRGSNQEAQVPSFGDRAATLRNMGAQLGADYIFMVGGAIESRAVASPLVFLNLAIVPCFILPSEKVYVDAKAAGALIEARSGRLVAFVNAEASESAITPSAFIDQTRLSLSLSQKAVLSRRMAGNLLKTLGELR